MQWRTKLKRKKTEIASWVKTHPVFSTANVLAILGIVIAIVYGWIGYQANQRMEAISESQLRLSLKQDSTSIDLQHFGELLKKTDSAISLSIEQLKLTKEEKAATDKGNRSRFVAAIYRLSANLIYRDSAVTLSNNSCGDCTGLFIKNMLPIFESQLNNPYLCSDEEMLKEWVNAYVHLNVLGYQGAYGIEFGEGFDIRARTRLDETTQGVYVRRDIVSIWESIDAAFVTAVKKTNIKGLGYVRE